MVALIPIAVLQLSVQNELCLYIYEGIFLTPHQQNKFTNGDDIKISLKTKHAGFFFYIPDFGFTGVFLCLARACVTCFFLSFQPVTKRMSLNLTVSDRCDYILLLSPLWIMTQIWCDSFGWFAWKWSVILNILFPACEMASLC